MIEIVPGGRPAEGMIGSPPGPATSTRRPASSFGSGVQGEEFDLAEQRVIRDP